MNMKAILNVLDQDGKVMDSVSIPPGQEFYIGRGEHVVQKDYVFLKTIILNRKATKAYKNEQEG